MRHLTIPVALAVLFTVAGCGKSDNGGASSSTAAAPPPPATSPAAAPAPEPSNPATASSAAAPAAAGASSGAAGSSGASGSSGSSGTGSSSSGGASGGTASAGAAGGTQTAAAGGGGSGNGEAIYNQTCVACHGAGVAGAPKIGDKADWGPRIAKGKDTLYTHALQGFQGSKGVMPPKGGNTSLSDADVKAAVDYMVSKAQ